MDCIECPQLLMIGSAERNLGKTEFICRVIKHLSKTTAVVGLKITIVEDVDGIKKSPSLQHCESYNQLDSDFAIFEETDHTGRKDTQRMLRAGATDVFWVLSLRSKLPDAVKALFDVLNSKNYGAETPLILEGNSVRSLVDPSLHMIIKHHERAVEKESCLELMPIADAVVDSFDEGWSVSPDQLLWNGTQWKISPAITAIVLAGGKSSRMGQNKCLLDIDGSTLIEYIVDQLFQHFDDVLVSTNNKDAYNLKKVNFIKDEKPDCGPVMGLISSLKQSSTELNFVTTCDVPEIKVEIINEMVDNIACYDAVLGKTPDGRIQPLFGVYRRSALNRIEDLFKAGTRSVHGVVGSLSVGFIDIDYKWYANLNTPQEYEGYKGGR